MKAPDKIYLERDKETEKIDFRWGDRPVVHSAYEHIEYIRKDLVEHIIRGALGPQDALNKIRSL